MSLFKKISLALLVYLLLVIATIPAAQLLPRFIPQGVIVSDISGSVWNGRIGSVYVNGIAIRSVSWEVNPWYFFIGQLNADIKAGNQREQNQISAIGNLSLSASGVKLSDTTAYIPAQLIAQQVQLPFPVELGGRFKALINDYSQGLPYCESLNGKANWLNSEIQGVSEMISLGSFSADLACDNGEVLVQVKPDNRLALTGQARIKAQGQFSVEAVAKPESNLPSEVTQALAFVAQRNADGSYQIKL